MKICSATRPWLWLVMATVTLWACGSGDDGGGAGAPAPMPPKLGQPCGNQSCPSGTICEGDGPFKGICTAGCTPGACMGIEPTSPAQCIEVFDGYSRCGLICTAPTDCAEGSRCDSAGKSMVCLAINP